VIIGRFNLSWTKKGIVLNPKLVQATCLFKGQSAVPVSSYQINTLPPVRHQSAIGTAYKNKKIKKKTI